MVSPSRTTRRMKWEHGEAYPIGTETVAAPATVSGERHPTSHWPDFGAGKAEWSGDLRARRPAIGILTHAGRGCPEGQGGVAAFPRRAAVFPAEPLQADHRQLEDFMQTAATTQTQATQTGASISQSRRGIAAAPRLDRKSTRLNSSH